MCVRWQHRLTVRRWKLGGPEHERSRHVNRATFKSQHRALYVLIRPSESSVHTIQIGP